MQIAEPTRTPERRPTGRRRRMLVRSLPMFAWLFADVVIVMMHRFVPEPRWLMVHLLLLGAVSNAIVVWSSYFADAVLRGTADHARRDALVIGLLNVGALGVVASAVTDRHDLLYGGAVLVGLAAVVHAAALVRQLRTSLPARFTIAVRYYVTAALMLPVGAWLGTRLASSEGEVFARELLAHLALNLLGWVGLTIAGTVITLWPTMLRTRADDATVMVGRRAWWLLTGSTVLLAGAGLAGWRWIAVLAVLGYLAGLATIAGPLVREALGRRPSDFGTWSMLAGLLWWAGCMVAVGVQLTGARDLTAALGGIRTLVGPFAAGFVAQVVLGALSYLLPVVIGGGPSIVRRTTGVVDAGAATRVVLANASGLVFLLPVPSLVKVTTSLTVYAVMAWTIGLLVATVVTGLRLVGRRSGVAQASYVPAPYVPEDDATRRRRAQGQSAAAIGVLALLVVLAGVVDPVAVVRSPTPRAAAMTGTAAQQTSSIPATGHTTTVQVSAANMRFTPSSIDVPVGDRLVLEVTNTETSGQVHDLVLANGATTGKLAPGDTATLDAGIIGASTEAWCSIAGHRQMGMTLTINAVGAAGAPAPATGSAAPAAGSATHGMAGMSAAATAPGPDAVWNRSATPAAGRQAYAPELPPVGPERTHKLTFTVKELQQEVAPGVTQEVWTFNGTVPGTPLHGRIGDVFEITLVNDGTMGHGIDFHAGALAPDKPMRTIAPGQSLTYRFTATRAGVWMYHCSTMPMSTHIANGMYGAVVIDPPDLPPVAHEYLLVQGEQYYGPQGAAGNADKIAARTPDAVVFNGYPNQYDTTPLRARTGERVRLWVLDAGPNESLAFHVVGAQFDSVWKEGSWLLRCGRGPGEVTGSTACTDQGPGGSQTLDLLASQGGFVELVPPEAGHYSIVNHEMTLAERGAHGTLAVTD
ncbi:nitrite reductase (NO-forming) [Raineyella antarctica]|uniref:Copper-containing nitrite reductase n=1 Tax=Raineyella antarctica TaxID=1577474 RepID=A0A1G6H309_9ACTN|nr:multicopper oxidase domain-containing protein [Raineyella antarctica]SDB88687.1 nitrite reductase (NO-forming) [Raineyella antarctica]